MLFKLLAVALCAGLASAGCPTNVDWQEFSGFCYWRSTYATPWTEADSACATYGSGAHLASVHSLLENAFIVQTYNYSESWIGLNDIQAEGQFVWSDGSVVDFTDWAPKQPDNYQGVQDCVRMPYTTSTPGASEWDDISCSDTLHFICKMPATA